jgi:hypothetical protein
VVLRSCPVTAAAGVVTAEPSWVAERRRRGNPSELWPPSRHRRRRGRPGCPDAGHAVRRSVRVRCPPCGRTSVQLVWRTSGVHASGVHAPGVHAPGVHASGVIRVSGWTPVRCPRPLQPRWIRNTSVRRDQPRLVHWVRRVAVVGERLGRRCPNRAWRARDGRTLAVRGSHEGRRQTWRCFAGVQAAAPRSPPGRPGESWSRARCRSVGGEQGRSRCSQVPAGACWAGCRRAGRPWAGPGGGDHARWSVRWWWSGVVRRWRAHPVQREQTAAAARPRYVRGAVR